MSKKPLRIRILKNPKPEAIFASWLLRGLALSIFIFAAGCAAPDLMRYKDCKDIYHCQYHYYTSDFKVDTRVVGGQVRLDILGHTPKTDSAGDFIPKDLDAHNSILFTFKNLTDKPLELHVSKFKVQNNTIDNTYTEPFFVDEEFEVILKDRKPVYFQILNQLVTNYATKIKISFFVKSPAGKEELTLFAERVEKKFNFFEKFFTIGLWE